MLLRRCFYGGKRSSESQEPGVSIEMIRISVSTHIMSLTVPGIEGSMKKRIVTSHQSENSH
jgi:hypothetical protein